MLRSVLALALLIGLGAFRLGQLVFGTWSLWILAGPAWAVLAVLALLLRWTLPIRLGILLGAILWLHWPWMAGALLAAPRLLLMLPGYVSTLIAQIRHPRPLWHHGPARGA